MPNNKLTTFNDLNLPVEIQKALDDLSFTYPTEIQKKAIALLLSEKKIDFHGQAQTGTGKTLAFSIPLLARIDISQNFPQALIVAPTRELAIQIYDSIKQVSKYLSVKSSLIYGGVSLEEQMRNLKHGVHIIIGTPGRINDHIRRKSLSLKNIKTVVLDEADIMLDMGFKEEIMEILSHCPKDREIWLFSATIKSGIEEIKKQMKEPVAVRVNPKQIATKQTEQFYCIVPFKARVHAIVRFIQSSSDLYGIIFCQTKVLASEVAEELIKRGYNVGALHGDMSQAHRNLVIKKFKQKDIDILVATDVAARGIDIANLNYVINYSIPEDLESYVHRIGRTGRAGKKGTAITFISKSELRQIKQIENRFGSEIHPIDVPSKQMLIDKAIKDLAHYIETLKERKDLKFPSFTLILDSLDQNQLKIVASSLLYDKFILPLDFSEIPFTHVEEESDEIQELFINMGSEDGITYDDVKAYLLKSKLINENQIQKIRIIKHRTFVILSVDCSPEILAALRNIQLAGKRVQVNVTCFVNNRFPRKPRPGRSGFKMRSRPPRKRFQKKPSR